MKISKALLVFIWFMCNLASAAIYIWSMLYAYYPKHPSWSFWVVPLQGLAFAIALIINIACIAILIFPDEWFVNWAEKRLKEIKNR